MPVQNARDLLLHIGNGGAPEVFAAVGAAQLVALKIGNQPFDASTLDADGHQLLQADAGLQEMQVALQGLFRDQAGEEALRAAAFARTAVNYKIVFPNGDSYLAAFAVRDYARGGGAAGLETFSVTLKRTGGGTFSPGA